MSIELLHSFDNAQIDATLAGMIGIFEKVFPDRIRAFYVIGSYLDGTYLPTSDIDGYVVFKDDMAPAEYMKARELGGDCTRLSAIALDFVPMPERVLRRYGTVDLKLASCLIYGEDIRDEVELLDVSLNTYFMMAEGLSRIANVRENVDVLTYPVAYPDADQDYYGYVSGMITDADGQSQPSTKTLINVVGKPATAIILHTTHQHVKSKQDAFQRYQSEIADEWAPLLHDVYEKTRNQWHYLVPQDSAQQAELNAICQRTLAFENHFLGILRDFLVEALQAEAKVSVWLPFIDIQMLMGLSPDMIQPLIANGSLETREFEGEQQVLIKAFEKYVAVGMAMQIVFPNDDKLRQAIEKAGTEDNPLIQQAVQQLLARP